MTTVKVINIEKSFEPILLFLFPQYSWEEQLVRYDKFIVHKEISSPNQMRQVKENHENGIVISEKLYDELWDADKLRELALDFRRNHFGTRKRQLSDLSADDSELFINNLVSFMFTGEYDFIEDEGIMDLFNSYGTAQFSDIFMDKIEKYHPDKVIASMMTFISKIMSSEGSVFYKRKNQALWSKVRVNFIKSFDYLKSSNKDSLNYLMFFNLLVK